METDLSLSPDGGRTDRRKDGHTKKKKKKKTLLAPSRRGAPVIEKKKSYKVDLGKPLMHCKEREKSLISLGSEKKVLWPKLCKRETGFSYLAKFNTDLRIFIDAYQAS